MARNGKVRNQAPKVEKQDKKKPRVGRCKKRIQYKRRIVVPENTRAQRGKKKGPNFGSGKKDA